MSSIIELIIISISLAMDSLSVSITGGFNAQKAKTVEALKVAAFFGGFQAGMPIIGWIIGEVLTTLLTQLTPWIAFGLLTFIGVKMLRESLDKNGFNHNTLLDNKRLTMLAIATSIDALLIGITLKFFALPLLFSITIIGIITFFLCFFGFLFGKKIGKLFGKRIEAVGGIALIVIGLKILIENLL